MPATAMKIAKKMNIRYSQQKLLDPAYNIALGTKYLKDQLNNYDNNYYNHNNAKNDDIDNHILNKWQWYRRKWLK